MVLRKGSLILLAAALAAPLSADQVTKRFDWSPVSGVQDINVEVQRVSINQITFDLGSTLKGTPVRKSSAKAKLRVDNNGFLDAEIGIAVVVFDAEGNVVATGSGGTQWGYLNKGDRDYYKVTFPYVYRNFERAKSFLITLETKEKGREKDKAKAAKAAPTPAH
ncbi:MAG: hypothetical protein ACRD3M_12485 [Thermoanaerobaculia bacterium]